MVFGTTYATEATSVTRSTTTSSLLKRDFKVYTWKDFGKTSRQIVMGGYQVNYSVVDEKDQWNYVDVNGQPQRYWDLAAYPYEFRAFSPYLAEAEATPDGITINKTFQAQVLTNNSYNVSEATGEPCVVAHVKRQQVGSNYEDTDAIKSAEINDANKTNATRGVHMPFHHLMSKIGFRIFIDNPQPTSTDHIDNYEVWIDNVTITVQRAGGFITKSDKYTADNTQNLGIGTFSENTTTTSEFTVLSHNEYKNTDQNLHQHLSLETAFNMTSNGTTLNDLLQIPQSGVKVHVKMTIHTNHVDPDETVFYYDSWLTLNGEDTFTWEPEKRYIYYLHIPNLHGHDIYLNTCEVLPWDEVQTTDIPIEL